MRLDEMRGGKPLALAYFANDIFVSLSNCANVSVSYTFEAGVL